MKFSVSRDQFLTQLGIAVRGVSTRSAIQTLAGVLIRAEGGALELQATDMELGIRVKVDTQPERDGAVVLPGRLLLDVVRSLPKDDLSLEHRTSEQDVEVVSGPAKFHLRTLPLDDFPKLPERGDAGVMHVPAGAFVETIGRVARSASRDETRPHLTGVLVSASGQELRMVATDSYRLVEGRFPNYRQLLPEAYEHELNVNGPELLEVVRRISLLAQKNAPLRMSFSEGAVEVSAQTPDVGEASESLPVPFKGEPLEIGFNPEFFRDGLESAESDELLLKLISPLRPGLIQSGDDGGFLYLVMPIRLNV